MEMHITESQDYFTLLLVHKGPVITHLLPYIDIHTKMFILPGVSRKTRSLVTEPTQHSFMNYVQSNLIAYAYLLSP